MAAIAGFLGLVLGSLRPNDPDAATKIDGQGALIWALAAAGIAAGLGERLSAGSWGIGLFTLAVGVVIAIARIAMTRPPQVPKALDLQDGINRPQGETAAQKMKNAERMYKKASFHRGSYYATRSPRDFRYGSAGAPASDLALLNPGLEYPNSNTFATLVVLAREIEGTPGEPVVVVAQTTSAISVDSSGIKIPGVGTIKAQAIAGMVGYAWR